MLIISTAILMNISMDQNKINFSSENYAGVQPDIMNALASANKSSFPSYGNDPYTQEAASVFKSLFGEEIEVFFAFNGTGANNFGIGSVVERYHSIFCTDVAHLFVDESTAPETFIGARIYPVRSVNGKMSIEDLRSRLNRINDVHHPQPKVVSITQPTEYGTVYSLQEIRDIKEVCTHYSMVLHVDGARYFNAAFHLGGSLKEISADIDILTLGGTKIGMMFGEAVIFFNPGKTPSYKYHLKRSMQLASKNRFMAVQFMAVLKEDLWKKIAAHANSLALSFSQEIASIPSIEVLYPVESNAVFVTMPAAVYKKMQEVATFYLWNEERNEYRFMFSFDTRQSDVIGFIDRLKIEMNISDH